jgi:hypothetical protein
VKNADVIVQELLHKVPGSHLCTMPDKVEDPRAPNGGGICVALGRMVTEAVPREFGEPESQPEWQPESQPESTTEVELLVLALRDVELEQHLAEQVELPLRKPQTQRDLEKSTVPR